MGKLKMALLQLFRTFLSASPAKKPRRRFFQPAAFPAHIAIIPDGNRRWAKGLGKLPLFGHEKGVESFLKTVIRARDKGVKTLTFYTFSTENWRRSSIEVRELMHLLQRKIIENIPKMISKGIRLKTIGDLSQIPESVQKAIASAKEQTSICCDIELVLAINYGGRNEIVRACQKAMEATAKGGLLPEEMTEELFSSFLDTKEMPDPDLIIRTGGERRTSNFLIWQSSYAEFFYMEKKWPEFIPEDLDEAIAYFQARQRRLGK
jgi:undecaprenyl diphosphate synthase